MIDVDVLGVAGDAVGVLQDGVGLEVAVGRSGEELREAHGQVGGLGGAEERLQPLHILAGRATVDQLAQRFGVRPETVEGSVRLQSPDSATRVDSQLQALFGPPPSEDGTEGV